MANSYDVGGLLIANLYKNEAISFTLDGVTSIDISVAAECAVVPDDCNATNSS